VAKGTVGKPASETRSHCNCDVKKGKKEECREMIMVKGKQNGNNA
jgi:hypothetical protein